MPRYIYSYSQHSRGSRDLARALGIQRIKRENSRFVGGADKVVYNWGASQLPEQITARGTRIINPPNFVGKASNKESCFIRLASEGVRTPDFTTDYSVAERWLRDGRMVFA